MTLPLNILLRTFVLKIINQIHLTSALYDKHITRQNENSVKRFYFLNILVFNCSATLVCTVLFMGKRGVHKPNTDICQIRA